jgi:hypothetical protein
MIEFKEYLELLDDRPKKFTAEEVGFNEEAPEGEPPCASCVHYYTNLIGEFAVCEILRLNPEAYIPPFANCKFWNMDRKDFPLLGPQKSGNDKGPKSVQD